LGDRKEGMNVSAFIVFYWLLISFLIISLLFSAAIAAILLYIFRKINFVSVNYRGKKVVNSLGLVFGIDTLFYLPIIYLSLNRDPSFGSHPNWWLIAFATLAIGTSVFGLIDDIWGDKTRGFKGHINMLLKGRVTTGFIKAIAGFILSAVASFYVSKTVIDLVINTFMITLFINFFNLLDLRPGRAIKVAFLIGAILFASSYFSKSIFLLYVGALIVLAYTDLTEKAMIGDAGSNFIGAMIGLIFATEYNWIVNLPVLAVLVLLQLYAEMSSFSSFIQRHPLLKWFDELGLERSK